jgi:hypothetical protein
MSYEEYSIKVRESWLFLSDAWKNGNFFALKLEEFQRSRDPILQRIVKNLSEGRLTPEDIADLNKRKINSIPVSSDIRNFSVVLPPLNSIVARTNSKQIQEHIHG